jgi:hypothetical protein
MIALLTIAELICQFFDQMYETHRKYHQKSYWRTTFLFENSVVSRAEGFRVEMVRTLQSPHAIVEDRHGQFIRSIEHARIFFHHAFSYYFGPGHLGLQKISLEMFVGCN